jgi:hypothetical protein
MGMFSHLFYPWGLILQGLAIVHFFRRRPDNYWFYVILFLGPPGALIYLLVEAIPDAGPTFKIFHRRGRISELERLIRDNPSSGNYEELGDLLLEDGKLPRAREAYDRAIAARATTIDPFYHRGVCALLLGDVPAALPDLERTVRESPNHDFQRAQGLLAHAYAQTAQPQKAEAEFKQAVSRSTLSETYLNYADFLAVQKRSAEACAWAQKVLDKRSSLLGYQRRRERPNFRRAKKLLKTLAAAKGI